MQQQIKRAVRCSYCDQIATILNGPLGAPKFGGWTRYGCKHGHRFALPTRLVLDRKAG